MSKTVIPNVYERSYSCPRCGVLCPQDHYEVDHQRATSEDYMVSINKINHKSNTIRGVLRVPIGDGNLKKVSKPWDLIISVCTECDKYTIWENDNVIFPFTNDMPDPEENMPKDVLGIYNEAAQVFTHSPRASAALLRIGIEMLLIQHLGVKKDSINAMIKELVAKGVPDHIQRGLDSLRYYGNQGAHLGEIDLNDDREKVEFLFKLINILIKELITKQKEIDSFYDSLPDSFKTQVEKRDTVKK